jgi:photosystem II stability/assembly factor-like uncharacterized protein
MNRSVWPEVLPLAIAMSGVLVALTVAGPQWQPQTSGVASRLRGVSAISNLVAWASGANGTVLRTLNGGRTWDVLHVPDAEQLDFRDIDAMSERDAYVLSIGPGEASRIYKTTDAGAHWTLQLKNTDPGVFLDAMAFWTPARGIAFSDSVDRQFVIFSTADGGGTWSRIPSSTLPEALPSEGAYAASGTNVAMFGAEDVWIGTSAARVLRSSNGGKTWSVHPTPLATGSSAGIFSIAFRDARHGIIVGGDYRKEQESVDNVATTADGGVTWTLVRQRGLSGFRSAVAPVPNTARTWIAVGPVGADRSDDDGRTWTALQSDGFDTVSFGRRSQVGWATGARGRIARLDW